MRKVIPTLFVLGLAAACATQREAQTAPGQDYQGEVLGWDEQRRTITLLQSAEAVRVRVAAAEMNGLRMHEIRTVHGVADGPVLLKEVMRPGAGTFVARGPAQHINVDGTVAAIDSRGVITISTGTRSVHVWTAQPGSSQFKVGDDVHARITVQPGTVVPASQPVATTTTAGGSELREPGEYAVVVGPVTAEDRAGAITVDTPRGGITLPMSLGGRHWTGEIVEVRTEVHPAR